MARSKCRSLNSSVAYPSPMQVDIEEDQFRAESKKLAVHLADPEVEVRMLLNMHAPLLLAYCHVIRL